MKKIFITLILIMMIVIIIFVCFFKNEKKENILNDEKNFKISEISIYSGANGENLSENYQNPEWNLNIYQYSDIAIYLNRIEKFNEKNNIKSLYINDINLGKPALGNPKLYYLNPLEYGSSKIIENDEIVEQLDFNILNSNNAENDMGYSIPIMFQDLSNPITLKYVNTNIVNSYKISNENKIVFDGSLLKVARVNLGDIENKISFFINIKTSDDKILSQKIEIDIPLKSGGENGIYDGSLFYKYMPNLSF